MCSDQEYAISVQNICKSYQIYERPQDRLLQMFFKKRVYFKEFNALKDINFSVKRGETVGIIGHNGAGKSTLLQIICGTLTPTSGEVHVKGKIAALLELGAGFNPDFTGKENVYLNAKILGLDDNAIQQKYNEILEFADIGDFINQPVKTYSSGMYVRLAFAVQACIEPEILIVDEALSVGDIGFQFKCFQRMKRLKENGTTILLVTHSTGTILEYADRCIVMKGGEVQVDTSDVLSAVLTYEKGMLEKNIPANNHKNTIIESDSDEQYNFDHSNLILVQQQEVHAYVDEKRFGTARAIIKSIDIIKDDGQTYKDSPVLHSNHAIKFIFRVWSSDNISNVVLGISISKSQGGDIWGDNNLKGGMELNLEKGDQFIEYTVKLPLSSGDYLLHCGLARIFNEDREELDQRRPVESLKFWSPREQGGPIFAPIKIKLG